MRLYILVYPPQWAHPRKRIRTRTRLGHPEKRCFFWPTFLAGLWKKRTFFGVPICTWGGFQNDWKNTVFKGFSALFEPYFCPILYRNLAPKRALNASKTVGFSVVLKSTPYTNRDTKKSAFCHKPARNLGQKSTFFPNDLTCTGPSSLSRVRPLGDT